MNEGFFQAAFQMPSRPVRPRIRLPSSIQNEVTKNSEINPALNSGAGIYVAADVEGLSRRGGAWTSVGRGGWSRVRSRKEDRKAARLEKKQRRFRGQVSEKSASHDAHPDLRKPRAKKPPKKQAKGGNEKGSQTAVVGLKRKRTSDETKDKGKDDKTAEKQNWPGRSELNKGRKSHSDDQDNRLQREVDDDKRLQSSLLKKLRMKASDFDTDDMGKLLPGFGDDIDFGIGEVNSDSNNSEFGDEDDLEDNSELQSSESRPSSNDEMEDDNQSDCSSTGEESVELEELSSSEDTTPSGVQDDPEAVNSGTKYVPPAMRKSPVSENQALERTVRGMLNKLVETNVEETVEEIVKMWSQEGRSIVTTTLTEEIIKAAATGPKATDQFVGISAAVVVGTSAVANSQSLSANFLARLALQLEDSYAMDDALGCRNMSMLLCHCYLCDLVGSELIYSLLGLLATRFKERDIMIMHSLLQVCGLRLRSESPLDMKDFVISVHERAGEASKEGVLTKQAELMLDLVLDIKNNRKKQGGAAGFKYLSDGIGKWLQDCGVAKVKMGALTWEKLLMKDKKGLWWLPDPAKSMESKALQSIMSTSSTATGGMELLKLAAGLKMGTDVRRAIFCVIMGSEDFLDAFNRLLGLPLKGNQQHEVVRVIVQCCLMEASWNPFYAHLISKLCASGIPGHKTTLQYCLWDRFKEVDNIEIRQMDNLAKLTASILAWGVIPLRVLKVVDFMSLSGQSLLFWRITLTTLMIRYRGPEAACKAFASLSSSDKTKPLQKALLLFFKSKLGPWAAKLDLAHCKWLSEADLESLFARMKAIESNI